MVTSWLFIRAISDDMSPAQSTSTNTPIANGFHQGFGIKERKNHTNNSKKYPAARPKGCICQEPVVLHDVNPDLIPMSWYARTCPSS